MTHPRVEKRTAYCSSVRPAVSPSRARIFGPNDRKTDTTISGRKWQTLTFKAAMADGNLGSAGFIFFQES